MTSLKNKKLLQIRKHLLLVAGIAVIALSFGYLNHSDTPNAPDQTSNTFSVHEANTTNANAKPNEHDSSLNQNTPQPDTAMTPLLEDEEDPQTALINDVMKQFPDMASILENIEHPRVQSLIEAMPAQSQTAIKMAALKHSVSKRLDSIESNPHSTIDLTSLRRDIDTLAENLVMMPAEASNLKAYLEQRSNI